jgi:hypothetical protein
MATPDPHPPSAHGVDIATSPMVTPMATPIAARPTTSNHQADAAEEEEEEEVIVVFAPDKVNYMKPKTRVG